MKWLACLTVVLVSALSHAAPSITSANGQMDSGSLMTITGQGFGQHGDFHTSTANLVRVFDNFNDGTLLSNSYNTWVHFNSSLNPCILVVGAGRTGSQNDNVYRRTSVGLGNLYTAAGNQQEYFCSFYMRLSDNFDITSSGSGTHQFKISRLFSTNSTSSGNKINVYPSLGASDGFSFSPEFISPSIARYQLQMNAIPNKPVGWHKMTYYYKKNSAVNAKDGRCVIWWDNKVVFDWLLHFQDPANNPSYAPNKIDGDFDVDDGNLAGEWSVGNYFSSASSQTWVDIDDIYMSHTQARVEIGNNVDYAQCTVIEIQEPVEWNSVNLKVRVNKGLLESTGYVFVTDSAGMRNSPGFPVNSGTVVDTMPPSPPE